MYSVVSFLSVGVNHEENGTAKGPGGLHSFLPSVHRSLFCRAEERMRYSKRSPHKLKQRK